MAKILLVEDNAEQALMVQQYLLTEHHQVEVVNHGDEGLDRALICSYDLIILDWGLPGVSGLDICKQYRQAKGTAPIMMLTGKSLASEKEVGLDSGADDYLAKPFSIRELGARVRALLRRASGSATNVLQVGDILLDPQKFLVTKGGVEITLAAREFSLLEFLMRHPDQVFSTDALLERVWHSESDATPDALRACVTRLRKKLDETDPVKAKIVTLHGVGYKLRSK